MCNNKNQTIMLNSYDEIDENSIMEMSRLELIEAVIRLFSVPQLIFKDSDSYFGEFLLPDDLADAFRGRQ